MKLSSIRDGDCAPTPNNTLKAEPSPVAIPAKPETTRSGWASLACALGGYEMAKWLTKILGEHVAFTGKAWLKRSELQKTVRRLDGIPTKNADITGETTVLVRGQSQAWKYGDHGKK